MSILVVVTSNLFDTRTPAKREANPECQKDQYGYLFSDKYFLQYSYNKRNTFHVRNLLSEKYTCTYSDVSLIVLLQPP